MKNKASSLDDIFVERDEARGPVTLTLHLQMFNECKSSHKIPNIWRKAKVRALLKPGKDPASPKSYKPIYLLCHTYKLFERIVLNYLIPSIDAKLIPEQAGFTPELDTIN